MFGLAAGGLARLWWEQTLLTWHKTFSTNTAGGVGAQADNEMTVKNMSKVVPVHLNFGKGWYLTTVIPVFPPVLHILLHHFL